MPDRRALCAILFVLHTGLRWEFLPQEPGFGSGMNVSASCRGLEPVTNALRYAADPVRVRLLLDRRLICEVSDGSDTSPHLRHAATTEEGGRGLFLVAECAERSGTRYVPGGKIVWAEQALPDARFAV